MKSIFKCLFNRIQQFPITLILCTFINLPVVFGNQICEQSFYNFDHFFEVIETLPYEYPAKRRLEIAKQGESVLREDAESVPKVFIRDVRIQALIDQMFYTMKQAGGVGIAAPQVFVPLRILIAKNEVMINPEYSPVHPWKTISFEGCLSMAYCGFVTRYQKIEVTFTNRVGQKTTKVYRGFSAIVIQHEVDHLNGTLFSDGYIRSYKNFVRFIKTRLLHF